MTSSNRSPLADRDTSSDSIRPRAAYIHVPFCAHRCGYCDFTLIAGRDDLVGDYLRALKQEIERLGPRHIAPLDSLFFGGGTPTHPAPAELRELFRIVGQHFQTSSATEISVEANPLDLTDEKIEILASAGVNRISLGVQSFSRDALKLMERDHTPEAIVDVMHRLRRAISNISLDLIFGIPGQTLEDWESTLRQAIALEPQHLSTYGLTFEQGTAFWTRRERGQLMNVDEELEREQYALAMELLKREGFEQYEISNFARPGYQCRHNHVYWSGSEYWAFGPGAARYQDGRRETNLRSVLGWLGRIERGESPVADTEELAPEHRARELIYLSLRRNAGLDRLEFHKRTGFDLDTMCAEALRRQIELGMLEDDGQAIRLSAAGRFVADRVVLEFL
ncbi:radical SAM family heme chaperone HemW [Schlesneria paludicola]|uniref:radical SAM family heme chaperone HemW n=1 Tax=Schlesneria paludicola TaxID=360056 RepID=UPI00029B51C6|nr:radical SAM family heme chaperone HemW [Schlesneria paludicola]